MKNTLDPKILAFSQINGTLKDVNISFAEKDVKLFYKSYGDESNLQKIICLPGLTRNSRDFEYFAASMSDKFHVISLDIPGRGQSDYLVNSDHYNSFNLTLLVQKFIESFKGYFILCGTSMGGVISMGLKDKKDSIIKGIILNDIAPSIPNDFLQILDQHLQLKKKTFKTLDEAIAYHKKFYFSFGPMNDLQWRMFTKNGMKQNKNKDYVFDYDHNIYSSVKYFLEKKLNLWKEYEDIEHPILIIRGSDSMALTKDFSRKMLKLNKNSSEIVIDNSGHAPHLMSEEQIAPVKKWCLEIKFNSF